MGKSAKNKTRVTKRSLRKIIAKMKVVFLDRDGTLIQFHGEPTQAEHIRVLKSAAPAVKILNDLGYLTIVVTNQPIIEKGIITRKQGDALNGLLVSRLKKSGARIDAAYLCPHKYPSTCKCRKPGIGMIKAAQKKFKIDLKKSFIVGDSTRDVMTGLNAKLKTILVKTGEGGKDRKFFDVDADYTVKDVLGAAKLIQ